MQNHRWIALVGLIALLAACGGSNGEGVATTAGGGTTQSTAAETPGAPTSLTVLLPVDSPNMYGFRVAAANGYFDEEDLDVTLEFVDGSGAAMQQLLADNGQIANLGTANVAEAIEEGHDNIRAIGNVNYESIFLLTVPEDSDIQSPADLEGRSVGVSELSGGEVPVVRGMIASAGLDPDTDVEIVPIGTGTALAVQAIDNGTVDAYGGSVNDIVAVEVQGLSLRTLDPGDLSGVPALPIVTTQEFIDSNPDAVEGFLRAVARGADFGQQNPEDTLAILKAASPEQFTDETGELIFQRVIELWQPPDGEMYHSQSVESWEHFFDVIAVEVPEGTDLSEIIVDDFVEAANDF